MSSVIVRCIQANEMQTGLRQNVCLLCLSHFLYRPLPAPGVSTSLRPHRRRIAQSAQIRAAQAEATAENQAEASQRISPTSKPGWGAFAQQQKSKDANPPPQTQNNQSGSSLNANGRDWPFDLHSTPDGSHDSARFNWDDENERALFAPRTREQERYQRRQAPILDDPALRPEIPSRDSIESHRSTGGERRQQPDSQVRNDLRRGRQAGLRIRWHKSGSKNLNALPREGDEQGVSKRVPGLDKSGLTDRSG